MKLKIKKKKLEIQIMKIRLKNMIYGKLGFKMKLKINKISIKGKRPKMKN
jgi:hypothetical protein